MSQTDLNPDNADATMVVDSNYVIFVHGIVFLTIINSAIWLFFTQGEEDSALLTINLVLSLFLLTDAMVHLLRRKRKLKFLFRDHGWALFVGSLPIPFFGVIRLLRTSLNLRRLRRSHLLEAQQVIFTKRAQTTLFVVILAAIIVYETAVLFVLRVEGGVGGANIRTAGDALWWGIVTISTVGYGDRFPVTPHGRIVGVALIAVGVGLFTSITSYMADSFRHPRRRRPMVEMTTDKPHDPASLIDNLRQMLEEQEAAQETALATMQEKLNELERQLQQRGDS
jgi:voltage-gated potassium channel